MAELTVRETLDFSRRVQGAGSRIGEVVRVSPHALELMNLRNFWLARTEGMRVLGPSESSSKDIVPILIMHVHGLAGPAASL